jgi:hypothetical protein
MLKFSSIYLPPSPALKPRVTQGDNPQISIHRYFIPGLNQGGCIRDAGNARQSIFAGDDSTMNQHTAPALDNGCR